MVTTKHVHRLEYADLLITKSGTAPIYGSLCPITQGLMYPPKETDFFVAEHLDFNGAGHDFVNRGKMRFRGEYENIFCERDPSLAASEASARYRYYARQVVPAIHGRLSNRKLVAVLPGPVSCAIDPVWRIEILSEQPDSSTVLRNYQSREKR